jgi:hypothetical protein
VADLLCVGVPVREPDRLEVLLGVLVFVGVPVREPDRL